MTGVGHDPRVVPDHTPRPPEFIVRLRAADPNFTIQWLRRLLKILGRRYGLKCISIIEVEPEES